jgi:hypothetical protein
LYFVGFLAYLVVAASCAATSDTEPAASSELAGEDVAAEDVVGTNEDEGTDAPSEESGLTSTRAVDVAADQAGQRPASATGQGDLDVADPETLGPNTQDLLDAADATLGLERIGFEMITNTSVPGLFTGSMVRSGWFDVQNDAGEGLLFLTSDLSDAARDLPVGEARPSLGKLMDMVEGIQFEYRLVGPTHWQLIPPQPDAPGQWIGLDVDEIGAMTGGDLEASVNGSIFLGMIVDSLAQVDGVREADDGSATWVVQLHADTVAPLAALPDTSQRLYEAGFSGKTDITLPTKLTVSPDGLITQADIDASEWWIEGQRVAAGTDPDMSVILQIAWSEAGPLPAPVAPCDEPTVDDSPGPRTLLCDG